MKSPFAEVLKLSFLGKCAQLPATSRTCRGEIAVLTNKHSIVLTIDFDTDFSSFFKKKKGLTKKSLQVLMTTFLLADKLSLLYDF